MVQTSMPPVGHVGPRGPRAIQPNQADVRQPGIRQPTLAQIPAHQVARAPRPPVVQPQPHPSIFDNKQENSLAQLRTKVPIVNEDIKYVGHDLKDKVPDGMPLVGCKFKMIEYTYVQPQERAIWIEAIEEAGGVFTEDHSQLTHLICETRLTDDYCEALKRGVRCITVYWVNDVIARNSLKYPWKALHFPKWFRLDEKPLDGQLISITNIKGRERREVVEMITKSGATYTDSFCPKNTLLICGSPGGEKYEKAIVWRTPIASSSILIDFIIHETRDFKELLPLAKYQSFKRSDMLCVDSYTKVREIMLPWMKPIPVPGNHSDENTQTLTNGVTLAAETPQPAQSEDSGIATSGSNNSDGDGNSNKLSASPPIEADTVLNGETGKSEGEKPAETLEATGEQKEDKVNDQVTTNHGGTDTAVECSSESKTNDVEAGKENSNSIVPMETNETKETALINSHPIQDASEGSDGDKFMDCKETQSTEANSTQMQSIEPLKESSSTVMTNGRPLRTSEDPIRLLFTRLEKKLVAELQSIALDLKLGLASSPNDCTHLIVDRISRTPKFICAMNHATHILNYQWLVESHKTGQVLDERAFILQDPEGEKKFSLSLVRSLLKRKKRKKKLLFTDYIFFVTPGILSRVSNLKEMIESAGGTMITRKLPTRLQLHQMRSNGKTFIVVTNPHDYHIVSSIEESGVDIVGSEFIMSGILRQDIDVEAHRLNSKSGTESIDCNVPKKLKVG